MMVLANLEKYDVILASGSPRRHELLRRLGIDFDIVVRPVDEAHPQGMKAEEIAVFLSEQKADAFESAFFTERTLLITADTIVCLGDTLLGKPNDRDEAVNILESLSGRKHRVITGVSMRSRIKRLNFTVGTDVYFKNLRKDEIEFYVDHYEPYDKAGAYGIQEWIGYVGIERIDGSFYNVMGLPVLRLYEELRNF
jgi:septum formation protein